MTSGKRLQFGIGCALLVLVGAVSGADDSSEAIRNALNRIKIKNDICVVLGLPNKEIRSLLSEFVTERNLIVYFQSPDLNEVATMREAADRRGFLGTRIFVEEGDWNSVHLAGNLAGMVFVSASLPAIPDSRISRIRF